MTNVYIVFNFLTIEMVVKATPIKHNFNHQVEIWTLKLSKFRKNSLKNLNYVLKDILLVIFFF